MKGLHEKPPSISFYSFKTMNLQKQKYPIRKASKEQNNKRESNKTNRNIFLTKKGRNITRKCNRERA